MAVVSKGLRRLARSEWARDIASKVVTAVVLALMAKLMKTNVGQPTRR